MKIRELPDTEKPIFRLRYFGTDKLSNTELIQLITGANDLETASRILSASDDPMYLHKMTLEELEQIDGVGEATAGRLIAAMELGRRVSGSLPLKNTRIFSADDVYKMYETEFLSQHQEIVTALLLNAKYEVISRETISKGGIVAANVEPRDVFRPAVKRGATGIILVHNHPSGDPSPSENDIYATKQISQCGELLGVKLIDHIIIGHGRFSSLRDMNLMEFGDLGCSKVAERKNSNEERNKERTLER